MNEITVCAGGTVIELHPGLFAYFKCSGCEKACDSIIHWKELFCKKCSQKEVCNEKIDCNTNL